MTQNNSEILLIGMKIYAEGNIIDNGYLIINDTVINQYGDAADLRNSRDEFETVIDVNAGYSLVPGFIDLHIHGAGGADTMDATFQALETMANVLPKEGTTSFLATTMTQSEAAIEAALRNAANYMNLNQHQGKAEVIGIHLEGPFVNTKRAGAQPLQYIVNPNLEQFKHWNNLAGGQIKQVTLAPECPGGLELVDYLHENGIIASIGHSDASFSEVETAVAKGARQVTHLYNQMSPLHHREPGVVGAALLQDGLKAEIIVDGIHSRPEMVKLCFKQKGSDGMILITDAMRAKGLGDGTYDLGGQVVTVQGGRASLADGTLAGSVLTMGQAVKNMLQYTGCSLAHIIEMASINPAKQLSMFEQKGSIAVGKDADLVILDYNNDVYMTICRGKIAYHRGG
ncbi:N-acetylglucosamine-6-phosphate deacetylase [Bacillus marasmi]|uniref:N-acetylglucosamine-6-phosphate deacetylase n=1 Tax=Bacillus marasmi TaxID=1926279 RepID=UPI0011C93D5F|nr:N-acetylglucosamine-6-phosphate deacetylase [Bacillus marasmi]